MKQEADQKDRELEVFFAAVRDAEPSISPAFLEKVQTDALSVQSGFAPQPEVKANRGLQFAWPNWRAFAGLAACLVLGIGVGGGFATQIGALGDYYLSGGVVASDGLFPTGYDDLLTSVEG